ncbi:MAG TPA: alpha/beta hydrolase [Spirochaetia bacterium]|nr:alpha/beta hydrolase [Spirochaetia bacterium]
MELFVRDSGPPGASTVVLLHGGGPSGWMWDRCTALMDDFRCLVPDLPEHGRSRKIKPFTIVDSARRVKELIQSRVPGGRAHLVGHSLGAQVLVALLAMAPEVVDRAVVSSALVRPLPLAGLLSGISRAVLPLTRNRPFQKLQARAFHIPESDFEIYYDDVRKFSSGALGRVLAENSSFRLPPELQNTAVPTLVLAGEKELGVMRRSVRDLAATLPNARGCLIRGAGHAFVFEHPGPFTGILRAWFNGQPLPEATLIFL